MPRFEKGSQEAKDYMASIRAKKGGTPNPNKKPTKTQVKMDMGVDIPIVGSNTLIFPEYLAQPTKNGYKLVNPLTQQRHLASRAGKTAVKLVRKHIPDLILLEGQNEPIPLKLFSKKDRTLIDAHFENVDKHKNQSPELIPEIQKSIVKSRGRPEKLPKNIEFNKEKKKENIKMVITAKKQAGRKPKYATDEERKIAKRKQTLASNKKKRAEAKGKGMKGGSLRDDVMHILTHIVNEYFPNNAVVHNYLNNLGEDGQLGLVMTYISNDADDILGFVDEMMNGNIDEKMQNDIANIVAYLTNVSADEGAGTDSDNRSVGSVEGGTGILQDITSALKNTFTSAVNKSNKLVSSAKKYANVVISGRNDYQPKVRKILSELGTKRIISAIVRRTPVPSILTSALNAVSLGVFAKRFKNAPYDTLFHLSLVLDLEGGTKLLIEKNEVINMDKNPSIPPKTDIQLVSNIPANLSVNDMLQKAQQKMGGYYFSYSARDNNCQDFIMAILQANNMGNDETYKFVKQDTKQLFEGLTTLRKVSNTITDIGAKVNEITTGAGARTKKKSRMIGGANPDNNDIPDDNDDEDKPDIFGFLEGNYPDNFGFLEGTGLKDTIDFEDMKWGSLTKQVEVYNKQHNSNLDLHSFSMIVLANPDKFKERTKKRARFYINVINKKTMKNNISNNNITIMPKKAMKGGNVNPNLVRQIFDAYAWFRTLSVEQKRVILMFAVSVIDDEFGGILSDESLRDMGGIDGFVETLRREYTNVPNISKSIKNIKDRFTTGRSVASDIVDTGKDIFNRARETLGVGLYASSNRGNGLSYSGTMSNGAIITQNGVMYPTHTIIHYYGDPVRGSMKGGDLLSDIADAFNPDRNGVAQAFQEKIVKPVEQTIVKPAEQTFTPELGRQITTGLIRQALPAVIKGVVSAGTTAATGNPLIGFVAGQTAGKVAGDKAGEELAKATGYGVARKGRFVKGSKEAKDYMASLRAKKNA